MPLDGYWPPRSTGPGSNARRLHAAEFVLQFLDLVPEPGRDLELQLRRGGVHLVGELLDERHQVAACRAPGRRGFADRPARATGGGAGPGGQAGDRRLAPGLLAAGAADQLLGIGVLADDLVQDVRDALAQRLRVDAIGDVVGDLLVAAPVGLLDGPPHGRRDLVRVHVNFAGDV